MIEEKPIKCDGCAELSWIVVYDQDNHLYFCRKCIDLVGYGPPYDYNLLARVFSIFKRSVA